MVCRSQSGPQHVSKRPEIRLATEPEIKDLLPGLFQTVTITTITRLTIHFFVGDCMLGRFLKPRWQHRDPNVRIRALEALGTDKPEDREILAARAREDDDVRARATAAGRVTDLRELNQLIEQDPAEEVRYQAARQMERLLAGLDEQSPEHDYRLRLIEQTDNQAALYFVALRSPDDACRHAAVNRLTDPEHLLELALHGHDEPLRVAAAQRLQDPDALKRLTRAGRDKRVARTARETLKARRSEQARREEQQQELDRLERELRELAGRTPDRLYGGRVQQLGQQWEKLAAASDANRSERVQTLLEQCRDQLRAWESARDQSERADQAGREQQAAVETLEQLLREITPETWDSGTGSLAALLETQERRWETAREAQAPAQELDQRFRHQRDRLRDLLERARTVREREDELGRLLEEVRATDDPGAELRERIHNALPDWPEDIAAPDLVRELAGAARGSATTEAPAAPTEQERNEDAHRVLGALHRELGKKNLRHANRLWNKARALLDEHPDPTAEARMDKLRPQLDELRDWHAFAAEPKKRDLCERMEALANQDMDPQEKASAIQALHTEWQDLMSSDQEQDQELWERFRQASDQAYEPCREHFAELDREKAENLERKQALCDQLAEFIDKQDWDRADWPAVWEIRQRAPREWKEYEPVRFTDAREVKHRFSALLSTLDERLEAASGEHKPERERLLQQLEELAQAQDIEDAARQARQLQEQWKRAGWVHPNIYRGMNRRFRRLCDQIFQTRNEQRDARRQDARARREAVEAALERIEQRLDADPVELDLSALQADMNELESLECPPSAEKTLERREQVRARFRRLRERLPVWRRWRAARDRLDELDTAQADDDTQRQLAVALEVLADVESPDSAREERTTWQLEQLPAAMTAGGDGHALDEILQRLEDAELQSLDDHIRDRLKLALDAIEPRL